MNDDLRLSPPPVESADAPTMGMSSVYRLFEAFIALRERNERQHKLFEQTLSRARDGLQSSFNSFAAETQKAYQQLRQEVTGEKKFSLTLLTEMLDLAIEMRHIVENKPRLPDDPANEPARRWMQSVEVQNRKIQDAIAAFGIHPYDAVIGEPYNPALHERVGTKRVDGMNGLCVAEQKERGYASQQPGFVLRRPKILVSD